MGVQISPKKRNYDNAIAMLKVKHLGNVPIYELCPLYNARLRLP
jgi:hypothetical protein